MAKYADPLQSEQALKRLKAVATSMDDEFKTWQPHWAEVARFTQPRLGTHLSNVVGQPQRKGDQLNSKLLNGRGMSASQVLANGMARGLANPATPWFKLTTKDPGLRKNAEVKAWLADVEAALYAYFASINFYNSMKGGYLHLGVFATACTLMLESRDNIGVCYSLPAGGYRLALDHELNVNRLLRRTDMTVMQLYEKFYPDHGEDKFPQEIKTAYARGDYGITRTVAHYIEPNGDQVWGKLGAMNMPYRSYHWLQDDTCKVLSVGGFEEKPFMAPRWDVEGTDTYGRGPGMNALPALRQLQLDAMRKQQAKDYIVTPPIGLPQTMANRQVSLAPRSVTTLITTGPNQAGPIWEVDATALTVLAQDIIETQNEVDAYFYADLFMAITNMDGVQPRNIEEIASRNEEKLTQLGPVIDRNQNEMLRPAIDRAFGILDRAGELPEAPEILDGQELDVEFVGILAQMQKAVGVGSIERLLGFVGNLSAQFPEAADKIDVDQTIDEYAERIGAPPRMIRANDQVEEIRGQRAQMESMANAAGAMKPVADGAKAAELLSQTDTGEGASLLQRILGG